METWRGRAAGQGETKSADRRISIETILYRPSL
jgi:hypothetical protein